MKVGDKVRLKKFPEAKGEISRITKNVVWCFIDERTEVAFAELGHVEIDPDVEQ